MATATLYIGGGKGDIAIPAGSGGGGGGAGTAATVTSGETYDVLTTDAIVRFDTSGGTAAIADLFASSDAFIGQRVTFYWWAWNDEQTPPQINANGSDKMVPYSGQSTSGAAGLVTNTAITTPGDSFTLVWDGTEWTAES